MAAGAHLAGAPLQTTMPCPAIPEFGLCLEFRVEVRTAEVEEDFSASSQGLFVSGDPPCVAGRGP